LTQEPHCRNASLGASGRTSVAALTVTIETTPLERKP
jgi:hypothetical protein